MAQSVEHPSLAQVIISQLVSLSPASGSVLTARSLEPALDSVSPSLSTPNPLAFCLCLSLEKINIKKNPLRGAWVAQSVEHPTSAKVTISQSVSSSPESGSGLMAQSLEPASDSVSPSLSAPPPFMLCLSVSKINKH